MIVYWSPFTSFNPAITALSYEMPEPMLPILLKEKLQSQSADELNGNRYKNCPAFGDSFKNVFGLKLTHDYSLSINEDRFSSQDYDQNFFDYFVDVRSVENRMIGLNIYNLFISEHSLDMSLTGSYFSDNDFNNSARLIPGQFNIGKWIRPIECAFMFRDGLNSIKLNKGDIYAYVRFDIDEPVEIKRFEITPEISSLVKENLNFRKYKKGAWPLSQYYEAYKKTLRHKTLIKTVKALTLD
jgi:hypothetical protein